MSENFHFINFCPNASLETYANSVLSRLLDLAPADASTESELKKNGDLYSCCVNIFSASGPFFVRAQSRHPQEAIEKADRKIRILFSKWKQARELILASI